MCFDDKMFVLDDGIHTLAYFHKDLKMKFLEKKKDSQKWWQIRRYVHRQEETLTDKNKWMQIKSSAHKWKEVNVVKKYWC